MFLFHVEIEHDGDRMPDPRFCLRVFAHWLSAFLGCAYELLHLHRVLGADAVKEIRQLKLCGNADELTVGE